ncbi:hypothetical protein [Peribacillus butanolivorans]|uniref:hypothetical protein n=1 Tax=Peribacillus butanolivorans TaxID=421767 RepID=UPI0035D7E1D0
MNFFGEVSGAISIGFVSFNLTPERLNILVKNVMKTSLQNLDITGLNIRRQ